MEGSRAGPSWKIQGGPAAWARRCRLGRIRLSLLPAGGDSRSLWARGSGRVCGGGQPSDDGRPQSRPSLPAAELPARPAGIRTSVLTNVARPVPLATNSTHRTSPSARRLPLTLYSQPRPARPPASAVSVVVHHSAPTAKMTEDKPLGRRGFHSAYSGNANMRWRRATRPVTLRQTASPPGHQPPFACPADLVLTLPSATSC